MTTVLITGANRGIGLEMASQYEARGDEVIAVCRHSSPELQSMGVEVFDGVDVTSGGPSENDDPSLLNRNRPTAITSVRMEKRAFLAMLNISTQPNTGNHIKPVTSCQNAVRGLVNLLHTVPHTVQSSRCILN